MPGTVKASSHTRFRVPHPGKMRAYDFSGELAQEAGAVGAFLQDDEERVVTAHRADDVLNLQRIDTVGDSRAWPIFVLTTARVPENWILTISLRRSSLMKGSWAASFGGSTV